ncbi:amidohydrolase family protein [Kordiimonas sp. SCSIO 12610]|uniref:amidohydrolase family protein n=1 Tax=Kordiimonas sp. SCSIO 12610 TaxID=2829597 RepID=UPI00210DEB1C|nr:amidohydrolase family protein [Kordiimonas sp. SCSIO 12610]UTW56587.1 amidohydrolase family protein [Kordiimonas sp. SCSIO 12610]
MKPQSFISKLAKIVFILLIAVIGSVYLFFRWNIDQTLGGNTELVDTNQFKAITGKIAITNVNILGQDAETMLTNRTILIEDGRIISVSDQIETEDNFTVIDGQNKYLIPGLIDSHVHLKKSKNDLLLYIANGITHVGEMTGMSHHFRWKENIKNGGLGPDIFVASPKLSTQRGMNAQMRHIFEERHKSYPTEAKARAAVQNFHAEGYQAIKLSSDMSPEIYYIVNDEAKKLNLPVIGHVPIGLSFDDIYKAEQSQISHLDSITLISLNEFGRIDEKNSQAFLSYVKEAAGKIAKDFKKRDIKVASTVWLHLTLPSQDFDLPDFLKTLPYEYQNPGWVEGSFVSKGCLPGGNSYDFTYPDETSKKAASIYYQTYNEANKIITQALVKEKVTITAGTDSLGACGMIAGFALHQELMALQGFGLSPAEVLRSATIDTAKWMGINAGRIAPGARADLVLLERNPLEDISNTQSIHGVMVNGKYYIRSELDRMLKAVKEANSKSRKVDISAYLN